MRSYNELAQLLAIYNGSNEMELIPSFNFESRTKYSVIEDAKEVVLKQTNLTKSTPPHGYRLMKGYTCVIVHRKFLEYGLLDRRAQDLLKWLEDTWNPDET